MPDLRRRGDPKASARGGYATNGWSPESRGWSTTVPSTAHEQRTRSRLPRQPARATSVLPGRPSGIRRRMSPRACCRLAWAVVLIVLAACVAASAQTPAPTYEKSTEASIQGRVLSVIVAPADDSVHLLVASGGKTIDVYIAPQRFLKLLGIIFETGEEVEIVGSRVTSRGAPLMLARKVKRSGSEITLRHDDGTPAWEGWLD
jgi:hypothetical protein